MSSLLLRQVASEYRKYQKIENVIGWPDDYDQPVNAKIAAADSMKDSMMHFLQFETSVIIINIISIIIFIIIV